MMGQRYASVHLPAGINESAIFGYDGTHAQIRNLTSENSKTVFRKFHRRKQWSLLCRKKLEIRTKGR